MATPIYGSSLEKTQKTITGFTNYDKNMNEIAIFMNTCSL
jgi:hypothetical protein